MFPIEVYKSDKMKAHYAKMEILEVTYEPFTGPVPQKLDYKVRFMYQGNGSASF